MAPRLTRKLLTLMQDYYGLGVQAGLLHLQYKALAWLGRSALYKLAIPQSRPAFKGFGTSDCSSRHYLV